MDIRPHCDRELLFTERAALDNGFACINLNCWRPRLAIVPLDEVARAGGELAFGATHPNATVYWPPEGTVHEADFALRAGKNVEADGIGAAPAADEFAIGDEQA